MIKVKIINQLNGNIFLLIFVFFADNENSLSMDLNYLPLYGIVLLTHSSLLHEDPNDLIELRKVEKCLKFLIDPLIDTLESTNHISYIKQLIRKVKFCKNKFDPENEHTNVVSY